jgi:hypothetical protein
MPPGSHRKKLPLAGDGLADRRQNLAAPALLRSSAARLPQKGRALAARRIQASRRPVWASLAVFGSTKPKKKRPTPNRASFLPPLGQSSCQGLRFPPRSGSKRERPLGLSSRRAPPPGLRQARYTAGRARTRPRRAIAASHPRKRTRRRPRDWPGPLRRERPSQPPIFLWSFRLLLPKRPLKSHYQPFSSSVSAQGGAMPRAPFILEENPAIQR